MEMIKKENLKLKNKKYKNGKYVQVCPSNHLMNVSCKLVEALKARYN